MNIPTKIGEGGSKWLGKINNFDASFRKKKNFSDFMVDEMKSNKREFEVV